MFFIPIAVVVLIIMFFCSLYQQYSPTSDQNQWNQRTKMRERFHNRVMSPDWERELYAQYNENGYDDNFKIVCDFVGYRPNSPERRPFILQHKNWAVVTEMCKRGKLPNCALYTNINSHNVGYGARKFIEDFWLKVESELRRNGVKTFLVYTPYGTHNAYRFRDYVEEHGSGCTDPGGELEWANYHSCSLKHKSELE